jgi:arsenate reductase (glutaredoxin)
MRMSTDPLLLSYAGCSTCKRAQAWLRGESIRFDLRAIVERPPTLAELKKWVPLSRIPLRKWLNTSGASYRALGKAKMEAATDDEVTAMLVADGKLVKRPVLIVGSVLPIGAPVAVLVGFDAAAYAAQFGARLPPAPKRTTTPRT